LSLGFFLDHGPEGKVIIDDDETSVLPENENKRPSAWIDQDDELTIQLKLQKRTKKLRQNEVENEISGKEYEERLKIQFEKLFPKPSWLIKSQQDSNDNNSDQGEETSLLNSVLSQLLQSTTSLSINLQKRQILNPDKLVVVRLKDANQMGYSKVTFVVYFIRKFYKTVFKFFHSL
jgi:U3 small nucleolar RNA-associated protein 18